MRAFSKGRICALVLVTYLAQPLQALNVSLQLSVSESLNSNDGNIYYRLHATPLFLRGNYELISPSGPLNSSGTSSISMEFDSFNDLTEELFGEWEFRVAPQSDPTNFESHCFTASPFSLNTITVDRPRILGPARDHFGFGEPFHIVWDPPSDTYSFGAAGMDFKRELLAPGVFLVELQQFLNVTDGHVRFATSQTQSLSSYISEAVPDAPSPVFNVETSLFFFRTVEKTFYYGTVPEPNSLSFLLVCWVLVHRITRATV